MPVSPDPVCPDPARPDPAPGRARPAAPKAPGPPPRATPPPAALRRARWRPLLAALALLSAPGCAPSVDPLPRESNAEAHSQPLAPLFPESAPSLPPPYAGLKLGMTRAEALAKVPTLATEEALHTADHPLVSFNLRFDPRTQRLAQAWFALPKLEAEQALTKAWGSPLKAHDAQQRPLRIWLNPKARLRAVLKDGFGDALSLEFSPCLPAAVLVGPGPARDHFAFEAVEGLAVAVPDGGSAPGGSLLGATLPALRQAFGADLVVHQPLAEDAPPTARLWLPPIEFDDGEHTRVRLNFDADERLTSFAFSLPFGHSPGARDELLGLLEARFGAAAPAERYGRAVLTFVAAPALEVRENAASRTFEVRMQALPAEPAPAEPPRR